jgi:hypothetical protein
LGSSCQVARQIISVLSTAPKNCKNGGRR